MPNFSIVIVNYNHERYLKQAIRSVLDQSCQDFELIIVDGASTDNSVEIIEKYAERLAWWVSEQDKVQSEAFNKGFAKAKGEFLLWLNADDLMFPGALDAVSLYLRRHPDCMWLAGDTVYFDSTGMIQRCLYGPYWNTWLMKQTMVCNMVNGPSSIFHHSLYEKAGGMDPGLHYVMDMDLWMKFVDLGARFHRLHRYIWGFRIHEDSKTSHSFSNSPNEKYRKERLFIGKKNNHVYKKSGLIKQRLLKLFSIGFLYSKYESFLLKGKSIQSLKY